MNGFYTGSPEENQIGFPQNYYAWTWGNALFVVLDPYSYTLRKPNGSVDNWAWTLGDIQYTWFKNRP